MPQGVSQAFAMLGERGHVVHIWHQSTNTREQGSMHNGARRSSTCNLQWCKPKQRMSIANNWCARESSIIVRVKHTVRTHYRYCGESHDDSYNVDRCNMPVQILIQYKNVFGGDLASELESSPLLHVSRTARK